MERGLRGRGVREACRRGVLVAARGVQDNKNAARRVQEAHREGCGRDILVAARGVQDNKNEGKGCGKGS